MQGESWKWYLVPRAAVELLASVRALFCCDDYAWTSTTPAEKLRNCIPQVSALARVLLVVVTCT